ncbi:hypothetical protein HYFRA_00012273 [Hymenoscyphus fraxineus]|uniref:Major facilitator superfamily (MFS) profile domain-containing protein n=1 Tax=Hymenoscyphus fraxineus TaxID=746836 RepID=A0A9N9KZH6_9HELO|nr:hypothetical protein HYFRA_00012273 [Hymenoscyphus fraxineus]
MEKAKNDALGTDDAVEYIEDLTDNNGPMDYKELTRAREANEAEKKAEGWQAFKDGRKAIFWSAIISLTIVMEGYDIGLIGSFFAYPAFVEKFGTKYPGIAQKEVSAPWQSGLGNAGGAGVVIGGFLNGFLSTRRNMDNFKANSFMRRYGYKKVIIGALFFLNWFIFIPFFAESKPVLVVGQVLCGLTWGVFATTGPAYASEVCPLALRGYLTTYINLCWATGQLIAAGALKGLLGLHNEWGYRIAYGLQWAWPVPLMCFIAFAPESPWWLLKHDRAEDAWKALAQLDEKDAHERQKTIAQMRHTLMTEEAAEFGTSYFDLFKGVDLRRTEIVCVVFAGQVLSGSSFAYGPTYFFQQAGIDTSKSYGIALGGTGLSFVGTVISWYLLTHFGRRTLYFCGMAGDALCLLLIAVVASSSSSGAKWAQVAFCLLWLFIYSMTLGPICYAIISETSSIRLRAKSICFSRNVYNIVQISANVAQPYLLNPTELNLKGKTGYVWFSTACVMLVWIYFRLPECKGRTYEELDDLFIRGVSARNFASTKVDVYAKHFKAGALVSGEDVVEMASKES